MSAEETRYPWLWDVDLDNAAFERLLHGGTAEAGLSADWAILRLIEHAPYHEIRRLLPLDEFLRRWPALLPRVRSVSRREGMVFFASWVRREGLSDA